MQLNDYLSFIKSLGLVTIKTNNCAWQEIGSRAFITAPESFPVFLQDSDIRRMFFGKGALFLRIIEPENKIRSESEQWHRFICRSPYDLKNLTKKTRNQTRRGLEHCQVRRITFDQLAEEGVQANIDTHKRHGLIDETTNKAIDKWKNQIRGYRRWPDVRTYAAIINEPATPIAAFVITILIGDSWIISVHRSTDDSLSYYPNNALIYQTTKDLLNEPGVKLVTYGLEPLGKNESLKRFKVGLGFQPQPVRHRVLIHPLIRPLLSQPVKPLTIKVSHHLLKLGLISNRAQKQITSFYEYYLSS